jgi:hypothetical protein
MPSGFIEYLKPIPSRKQYKHDYYQKNKQLIEEQRRRRLYTEKYGRIPEIVVDFTKK